MNVRLDSGLGLDVSRETSEALKHFCDELLRWSRAINLVAETTHADAWSRHIVDSLQIVAELEGTRTWVDVGSGGGLPALPLAIVARERAPQVHFVLVESDKRKAAFLKTQCHALQLNATVRNERVETIQAMDADVLSARAFAPLEVILKEAHRLLRPSGIAVLHKGRSSETELTRARAEWAFSCTQVPSIVEKDSVILRITDIKKKAVSE